MTRPLGSELIAEDDCEEQLPAMSRFVPAAVTKVRESSTTIFSAGTYSWVRNWTGRLNLHDALQELDAGNPDRIRKRVHSAEDIQLNCVHVLPRRAVLRMLDTITICISIWPPPNNLPRSIVG